jgi:hypothetical protein
MHRHLRLKFLTSLGVFPPNVCAQTLSCSSPSLATPLVQLLPQSISHIGANEEAGGGNRISEEQIKNYMEKTLGEAPRPAWGVSRSTHSVHLCMHALLWCLAVSVPACGWGMLAG